MTLANRITILRILLIPVFMILYLQKAKYPALNDWALAIFAFAVLTDILDGLAARIRKERTPLGTFLDPLADKLLLTAAFAGFAYVGEIPVWIFVTVFSRDLIIVLGWAIIYILTHSSDVVPRQMGKICTFLQMAAAIGYLFPVPAEITTWVVRFMLVATFVSAIDYITSGSKKLELVPL